MLVILIWMATLVALFYGFENWRGYRAWKKYEEKLVARGAQLDLRVFIPKPVPNDQNFASTPFVKAWFERKTRGNPWPDSYNDANSRVVQKSKNRRQLMDLGAWQKAFAGDWGSKAKIEPVNLVADARAKAAREILEELKSDEPWINEFREASQRPFCRYPVQYDLENPWGILLPHLAKIRGACQRLELRTCAELASGQMEQGMADLKLMFYLVDSLKEEPFLIAYLVRVSDMQTAAQPVWEGLVEHRWTEEQLKYLQGWFERDNFKAEVKKPLDTERAAALLTVDLLRRKGNLAQLAGIDPQTSTLGGATWSALGKLNRYTPRGWAYQEQLTYCRLFDEEFESTLLDASRRIIPAEVETRKAKAEQALKGSSMLNKMFRHNLAASLLLPALGNIGLRSASAQVCVDQAAIACALERYRLSKNEFPSKLEDLTPQFMTRVPLDMLSGQTYRYERKADNGYILYSLGWDAQDNSGEVGARLFDTKRGDWVWQVP
jgi:hypothetical protein